MSGNLFSLKVKIISHLIQFLAKKITNHANNEEEITIRVKDREGEIIIEELTIQSGTVASLQELKLFVNYQLEIKKPTDNVLLCIY